MTPETIALAVEIADSCARSDIECNCPWRTVDDEAVPGEIVRGVGQWYDTAPMTDEDACVTDREWLTQALRYLELCGMLIRNDTDPALVRVRDEPECA